tara:strand:+ start:750 stop:1169 length:420 start_codon:yes stop_codon:yes gene_type:complete
MSTLITNTFTGKTSAGSIVVTGEGGSTTTNLQQGLAKVWVKIDGTQSAGSMIQDNLNVGSMTDSATGKHIINFTNNMSSAHYSSTAMARQDGSDDRAIIISQEEDDGTDASNLPITTQNDGGSYVDTAGACVTIHGDLA